MITSDVQPSLVPPQQRYTNLLVFRRNVHGPSTIVIPIEDVADRLSRFR